MIEALLDFFQLYTVDADYLPDFWLTMILLYLNAGLYLNDLYNLVKRKSKAETFSLMAIPGVFAVIFVSMLSIFAHVPNLQSIASQAKRLSLLITAIRPQTNLALLLIVFLYTILWGIGLLRQRRHEHGSRKRWVLSCIPDYIAWIILILGIGYHLFFGENILNSVLENAEAGDLLVLYGSRRTWLYIWMYGIYILVCKEVVLLVGLLSELLLMRIPLRYHSGQNADTFVSFYYLFCQNAIFRGISLLEAALVIPLCGVMLREAASPFSDYSSIMIYAVFLLLTGAVFVVLIAIGPIMRTLSCFDAWGRYDSSTVDNFYNLTMVVLANLKRLYDHVDHLDSLVHTCLLYATDRDSSLIIDIDLNTCLLDDSVDSLTSLSDNLTDLLWIDLDLLDLWRELIDPLPHMLSGII